MATKSKKYRPWVTFLFFFLAASGLLVSFVFGLYQMVNYQLGLSYQEGEYYHKVMGRLIDSAYQIALNGEYYSVGYVTAAPGAQAEISSEFAAASESTAPLMEAAPEESESYTAAAVAVSGDVIYSESPFVQCFRDEGENIEYLILGSGISYFTNSIGTDPKTFQNATRNQNEFISIVGDTMRISRMGKWGYGSYNKADWDGKLLQSEYMPYLSDETRNIILSGAGSSAEIYISVKDLSVMQNYGEIYRAYYNWSLQIQPVVAAACVFAACLLVLIVVLFKRKSLAMATAQLAKGLSHVWLELKLVMPVAAVILGTVYLDNFGYISLPEHIFLLLPAMWWLWLLFIDLRANKARFFTHNSFTTAARFLRSLGNKYAFLERMKRRFIWLILAEFALLGLSGAMVFAGARLGYDGFLIGALLGLISLALAVFLLLRYLREYNRNMDEFGLIVDYAAQVRAGTATAPLALPPENDFAPLAADLSDIHSGISRAVEERVRSEKMKVELVTNVSHDLKTPLTSIINYVDLLGKEALLPDFTNDYVKIIAQKADRLKNLVQDLFEISKANSGAAELNPEQLDLVSLVEQTLAEMDGMLGTAGVEIKTQFSASRPLVLADGKKLHRVFENLLGNALKYSLTGTRVYISVREQGSLAEVTFKNVAGYEMTFTAEEIIERFQRGDSSRATEGSGLGLAIARSFLELSGGRLTVELDGDLFKAIATLPLCGSGGGHAPADNSGGEAVGTQAALPRTQELSGGHTSIVDSGGEVAAVPQAPSQLTPEAAEPQQAEEAPVL